MTFKRYIPARVWPRLGKEKFAENVPMSQAFDEFKWSHQHFYVIFLNITSQQD